MHAYNITYVCIYIYICYIYNIQYHWVLPFYLLIASPFFHPNSVHRFVSSRCRTRHGASLASRTKHRFVSTSRKKRALRGAAYIMCPRGAWKKDGCSWGWATGEAGGELRKWTSNSIYMYIYSIYIYIVFIYRIYSNYWRIEIRKWKSKKTWTEYLDGLLLKSSEMLGHEALMWTYSL